MTDATSGAIDPLATAAEAGPPSSALGRADSEDHPAVESEELWMPEPDVREAPDAGAITWHEQVEPAPHEGP
jgi:hypothetical protein